MRRHRTTFFLRNTFINLLHLFLRRRTIAPNVTFPIGALFGLRASVLHAATLTSLIGVSMCGASCSVEGRNDFSGTISSSGGESDEKVSTNLPAEDVCPGHFKACTVDDLAVWKPLSERPLERGKNLLSDDEYLYFLADKAITDDQLQKLRAVHRVRAISLTLCTRITDKGLNTVAEIPDVRYLNASFCDAVTDQGVKVVASANGLWKVSFCGCKQVTDVGAVWLGTSKGLRVVDLSFANISSTTLKAFGKASKLEELVVQGCNELDGSAVNEILTFTSLVALNVGYSLWVKDDVVVRLSALKQLKTLSLDGCPKLTKKGLSELEKFTTIEELSLAELSQLTMSTLRSLLENMPNLKKLNVAGCENVSSVEVDALKEQYPKLSITSDR